MNAEELYQEVIMDHATRPRNFGELPGATVTVEAENPMCGDELTLYLTTDEAARRIEAVRFKSQACAICTASASLLTTKIRGLECPAARELSCAFQQLLSLAADAEPHTQHPRLGNLEALAGVRKFPMRVKCATLAWHALDQALDQAGKGGGQTKLVEDDS